MPIVENSLLKRLWTCHIRPDYEMMMIKAHLEVCSLKSTYYFKLLIPERNSLVIFEI